MSSIDLKLFEPAFPEMQFHLTCLSGFCNFQAMKTLYDIDVNSDLIWDHDFAREQFQEEPFFILYLGRLLERGTSDEVKKIPSQCDRTLPGAVVDFLPST